MPNRIVRDGMLESEAVLSQPPEGRWLYVSILLSADDYGLFEATTYKLAKRADIKREHVPALLQCMVDADLVRLYRPDLDGTRVFGLVTKFAQRFRIQRAKYPLPPLSLLAGEDDDLVSRIKGLSSQMTVMRAPMSDSGPPETETETETETEKDKDNTVASLRVASAPAAATRTRAPACPTEALVALWHEHCAPPLATVGVLNEARRSALATRWREVCTDAHFDRAGGLEWFRWLFVERVAASDFLMGRRPSRGHEAWRMTWDWLMRPTNFAKVVDGNYTNGGKA